MFCIWGGFGALQVINRFHLEKQINGTAASYPLQQTTTKKQKRTPTNSKYSTKIRIKNKCIFFYVFSQ